MTRYKMSSAVAIALVLGLLASDAMAVGERTRKSVANMGLQLINRTHPKVFRSEDFNYEADLLRGAEFGLQAIDAEFPLNSEAQVLQAISSQIALLRDAREYGVTSYFAYRMGVLAALTTHAMLPYGIVWTQEERSIQDQLLSDFDANLESFRFRPQERSRTFILDVNEYFNAQRQFVETDKAMILEDYQRNVGMDGFLGESWRKFLEQAIIAVGDVWHTVLRQDAGHVPHSGYRGMLARYLVGEIAYQLEEKGNIHRANEVYENFVTLNVDMPQAYESIGDLYYEYGTEESRTRALREWEIAYSLAGAERRRIAEKISSHFMSEGRAALARAESPDADDADLPSALNSFEQALEFDRFSDTAVEYIQRTHVAIAERQQRFDMNADIIASASGVRAEAVRARQENSFGNAIQTYRQALSLFNSVDDEFPVLAEQAEQAIREVNRELTGTITEIEDQASAAIDDGDRARDENRFDAAINSYERVPQILADIPDDYSAQVTDNKLDLIQMAEEKVEDARLAQIRYEQALREQEEAAAQGGGQQQQQQQPQTPGGVFPGAGGQQQDGQQPGMPGLEMPGMPMPGGPQGGGGGNNNGLGFPGLSAPGQAAGGLAPL